MLQIFIQTFQTSLQNFCSSHLFILWGGGRKICNIDKLTIFFHEENKKKLKCNKIRNPFIDKSSKFYVPKHTINSFMLKLIYFWNRNRNHRYSVNCSIRLEMIEFLFLFFLYYTLLIFFRYKYLCHIYSICLHEVDCSFQRL